MNPPCVQQAGAVLPLAGSCACFLLYAVEVGCEAAVVAVAGFLFDVPVLLQIADRTLDRALGETEIDRDGLDPRPTFAFGRGHALEVHVDGLRPVRQAVVGVNRIKIADGLTSYVLMWVVSASGFGSFPLSAGFLPVFRCFTGYFSRIASMSSSRPA